MAGVCTGSSLRPEGSHGWSSIVVRIVYVDTFPSDIQDAVLIHRLKKRLKRLGLFPSLSGAGFGRAEAVTFSVEVSAPIPLAAASNLVA